MMLAGALICSALFYLAPTRATAVVGGRDQHATKWGGSVPCLAGPQNTSNSAIFETYTITAPDGSINASFIPLGASVTNLYVKARDGSFRDVVLGYDNRTQYLTDPNYAYFGPIVGRYANRIRNSSFSLPPKRNLSDAAPNTVYHVTPNENNDEDTLHGGLIGTSHSGWCVLEHSASSIQFGLLDVNGTEGFPGTVLIKASYSVGNNSVWTIKLDAEAFSPTPLLLSSHVYWNLDGYIGAQTILNHTLLVPSKRYVETDGIEIPTGGIAKISPGDAMDFTEPKLIGKQINETLGKCGTGCIGYDTCWIYEDDVTVNDVAMELASSLSGIKLSVRTNQPAGQVYTCSGQHGLIPRKVSQGGPNTAYDQYSCVVLEQEGWIDAINQPEWGQNQVYGTPGREHYNWWAEYTFSIS